MKNRKEARSQQDIISVMVGSKPAGRFIALEVC